MEMSSPPSVQPRRFRWWIVAAVIGGLVGLLICAIIGVGVLSLLGRKVEPSAVTATDGQSKVMMPAGWSVQDELHDDAEIQVANPREEQYMIVLTENKDDFVDTDLQDYAEITLESLAMSAGVDELPEPQSLTINGLPAIQYEISGTVDNMKVVYWLTDVEGTENYYQVLTWTLASQAEDNRAILQKAVESFEEIVQ